MFGSLEETERGRKLDPTPERIVFILLEEEKKILPHKTLCNRKNLKA